MKTTEFEFLWWVETIRQDDFRRILPLIIVTWVTFTICLISFIVFFILGFNNSLGVLCFRLSFTTFFIGLIVSLISSFISKGTYEKIRTVKRIWENSNVESKNYSKELRYFYAHHIDTK